MPPPVMPAPARRYDLLIFDFDGTLADSTVLFDRFIPALGQQRGVPEPVDGWHSLRGLDSRAMLRALRIRWWQLPGVTRQMRAAMATHLDLVQLYPGMLPVLQQLQGQGVQMVVVSSNSQRNVAQVLGPALPLFTALHCGASLFGKRRVMARALRQSGVPASRALSIGDECRDAQASQACGIAFAGVSWGMASAAVLQPCSAVALLEHPQELIALVGSGSDPG
jgi:phosphoglycolate phosphatase